MNAARSSSCRTLSFLITILCLLFAGAAQATIIHVPADQPTIQEGINSAVDGDTVLIADGTYTGFNNVDLAFGGMAITVRSESDNPAACVIDCQGIYPGIAFLDGEGPDSVLRGVTFKNCVGNFGAAMLIFAAAPTITNCVFTGNSAADFLAAGGAVASVQGGATFTDCVFDGNSAVSKPGIVTDNAVGGAFYAILDAPTFVQCIFRNNTATSGDNTDSSGTAYGGALAFDSDCYPFVVNCTFEGNVAEGGSGHDGGLGIGGAIASNNAFPGSFVANCLFSGNKALGGHGSKGPGAGLGGGVALLVAGVPMVNCTFSGNSAMGDVDALSGDGFGGALFTGSATGMVNCIFYGDASNGLYPELVAFNGASFFVEYSIVQGGFAGPGNSSADPLFVRAPFTGGPTDFGDLHVQAGSPAIDTGLNDAALFFGLTTDLDGSPRIHNGTVDIGAYEFSNHPPVANAGPDQHISSRLTVLVTLDGSASSDPDHDPLTYVWKEGGHQIATGVNPSVFLDPGIHTITLTVNDGHGGTSSDDVVVTVDPRTPTAVILSNVTAQRSKEKHFPAHLKTMLKHQVGQLLDKPINFYVDGNFIGSIMSANPTGLAFTPPNNMALGPHEMKVTFAGDLDYQPSEKVVVLTIKK